MELLLRGDIYAQTGNKPKSACWFLLRRGWAIPLYQLEIYSGESFDLIHRTTCPSATKIADALLDIPEIPHLFISGSYVEQDIDSPTFFNRSAWGFKLRTVEQRADQYVLSFYRPHSEILVATEYCHYREGAIRRLLSYQDY